MKKFLIIPLILTFTFPHISLADTFMRGRSDNGNISAFYTLSVRNNSAYTSIFNSAINNWNNISSRIKLKRVYSDKMLGLLFLQ